MTFVLIGIAVLVAAIALYFSLKKPAKANPPRPASPLRAPVAPSGARVPLPAVPVAPVAIAPMPEALRHFRLVRHTELAPAQADAIMARLRLIPRPPSALHKLVSPEFLADASSAQLSDVMMSEPLIAAKVLAVVNSPFYGLAKPLGSIGHAATFLGMNTVRGICLQYMLDDSLKASSPEIKKLFDTLWNASAFASELCFKLAQLLGLPEPGALVTQVVLSYLGQLATYSMLPPEVVLAIANQDLLDRAMAEQEHLGLSAAELGSLLLQEWTLPQAIIDDVRGIDLILVTPLSAAHAQHGARWALCYLCARLGGKLATGEISELGAFDLAAQDSPDFYHLRSYLDQPSISRLVEFLRFPDVVFSINQMVGAMQVRR